MSEKKIQIDEIGTVSERINLLVDYFCKGNKTAFGRAADIQSGVLAGIVGGRGSKPGFEILQKLLTAYPTVSPTWLLFGRGPMLQGEDIESTQVVPVALPSKELEEMVRQLVKNQLKERARRVGFTRDEQKKELIHNLARVTSDIEWNKAMMDPSVVARSRTEDGITDRDFTNEHLLEEIRQYEEAAELIREDLDEHSRVDERVRQEMRTTVYRLVGSEPRLDKPYFGLLHIRLSIPDKVAEQLVASGKIRSVKIEGEGHLITEQAVREFLGEA